MVHMAPYKCISIFSVFLHCIHCSIRRCQKFRCIRSVFRPHRDSETDSQCLVLLSHSARLLQTFHQTRCISLYDPVIAAVDQCYKLISCQAVRCEMAILHRQRPKCHFAQHLVPCIVSVGVVHPLKIIQIIHKNRKFFPGDNPLPDIFHKDTTVLKVCQYIIMCTVRQFFVCPGNHFVHFASAHIVHRQPCHHCQRHGSNHQRCPDRIPVLFPEGLPVIDDDCIPGKL